MYNAHIKEEFLSKLSEGSQATYRHVLNNTAREETRLAMDLYEFGIEEIKNTIKDCDPQTLSSSSHIGRVIMSYINWAIDKGYRNSNINPLTGYSGEEFYKQFVKDVKLFYSEEEIREIEGELVNYQDKIVLWLLFQGIKVDELINLKESDVDFENSILHLTDDSGNTRQFEVWDKTFTMQIVRGAINQTEYYSNNGIPSEKSYRPKMDLMKTKYVIRKSTTNTTSDKATYHILLNRLTIMKKYFGDHYTITPKKLEQSGMIKMGKDLFIRDGKLENEQLDEIAARFKVNVDRASGYKNYHEMKRIVNMENLKELYPEIH